MKKIIVLFVFLILAFSLQATACSNGEAFKAVQKHAESASDKGSKITIEKVGNDFSYSATLIDKDYTSNSSGLVEVKKGANGKCVVISKQHSKQSQSK